jgi:serine/threonine protein kinase
VETSSAMSVAAGTTIYMAPEILDQPFGEENAKIEFNSRADLWSLGVTLVEIARLQHPYSHCISMTDAIYTIAMGDPPILREDDGYTEDLLHVVNNCLIQDPMMRPRVERMVEMELVKKFDDLDRNREYMKKFIRQHPPINEENNGGENSDSESRSTLTESLRNLLLSS